MTWWRDCRTSMKDCRLDRHLREMVVSAVGLDWIEQKYMSVNSNVLILVNRNYTRPIISLPSIFCISHLFRTDGCINVMDGFLVTYHGWMLTKKKDFCRQAWKTLSWLLQGQAEKVQSHNFLSRFTPGNFALLTFAYKQRSLSVSLSGLHSKHMSAKVSEDDIRNNLYIIRYFLIKTRGATQ